MRLLSRRKELMRALRGGIDSAMRLPVMSGAIGMVRRNPKKAVAASLVALAGAMIARNRPWGRWDRTMAG